MKRLILGALAWALFAAPALAADKTPLASYPGEPNQPVKATDRASVPALKITGVTGSTQCLQADSAGVVTGTGSSCGGGTPGGASGQVQYNNAGAFGGFTLAGDCTLSVPSIACTKLNGVSPGSFFAGTDAANLTGTVSVNRFNSGTGASSSTYLRGDGTWATPAGSGGTVTSVGLALPSIFSVSGSPVTGSGTLSASLATEVANTVFAGPTTGADAAPTFRALVNADLPTSGVTAAAYTNANITVNAQGIVTAAANGSGGSASIGFNKQTGTSYTFVSGDLGKLVQFTGANPTATLPSAATMGAGWYVYAQSRVSSGSTALSSTSNIGPGTTYRLYQGMTALVLSDGTNYQVVPLIAFNSSIVSSTPGFSLQYPDAGSTGGNSRGAEAVDLQLSRSSAAAVASGTDSFVAGYNNTASALYAFALGSNNTASAQNTVALGASNTASTNSYAAAIGHSNTASGGSAVALGDSNTASASYCTTIGHNATCATVGDFVHGNSASSGWAQSRESIFTGTTAGASALRLTTDGGAAASTNVGALTGGQAWGFQAECVVKNVTHAGMQVFEIGPSLASIPSATMLVTSGTVTAGPASGTAFTLQANPSITADTTNFGLNVSFTPPSGNTDTFRAVCRVYGTVAN